MWVWVDRLGARLLDASVGATLLLGCATLAMLLCRQPARRLLIARGAVAGTLTLLPLVGLGLVPRFDLVGAVRDAGLGAQPWLSPRDQADPARAPGFTVTAEADYAPRATSWLGGSPASRLLTLGYVAGVTGGLAWLALGSAMLAVLRRRSVPPSAATLALYQSLFDRGSGPAPAQGPGLRVAPRLRRPVLVGIARPLILIPPALDRPEAVERLRLTLLHELAHAAGSDPWHGLLGNLALTFWFFLPPLWWVWSRSRLDQEFLADRRAAQGFGPLRAYAASLLELASNQHPPDPDGPAPDGRYGETLGPQPADDPAASPLVQRVAMLVRCPFPMEARPPVWWFWGLLGLLTALTLGVACLSVRRPDTTVPSNSFRVARLDLPVSPPDAPPESLRRILPVRLPQAFEITLDVWGDLPSLAATRVADYSIGTTDTHPPGLDPTEPPDWHHVRIRRERGKPAALWIDGHPADTSPHFQPDHWFSVQPAPGCEGCFRDVVLNW